MQKVMIVDSHPLIGNGISHILQANGYEVIANEITGGGAIKSALRLNPDLIIMDLHLKDYYGLEVIRIIREISEEIKIIVLTAYNDVHYQLKCKELGVEGYMLKNELAGTLIETVHSVSAGSQRYPALNDLTSFENSFFRGVKLSPREVTILECLASGMSNKDIALKLTISNKTVSAHKRRIMVKFNVGNLVDLLSRARAAQETYPRY